MERELLLLGLLRQSQMHGYELHEFINRNLTACTDLKKSTAYYLLDKMETAGWVTQSAAQAGNRPVRRVYAITEAGEAAFQRLLRENLATDYETQFTGDIGVTFLDALPAQEARTLLQQRRDALAQRASEFATVPPHEGSLQLMIEHQVRHLAAELDWLDTVIARLAIQTKQEE